MAADGGKSEGGKEMFFLFNDRYRIVSGGRLGIERRRVILVVEEAEMKSSVLETFLLGVTFGIGMTLLLLYAQTPGPLATSIETVAEMGRSRRAKEEERKLKRERLKALGFTDEEIEGTFDT